MKNTLWDILTSFRDKDLPEWLVEVIDWVRYTFLYPY